MDLPIGERWERFVTEAVRAGRFASASQAVQEALKLLEEREARPSQLRAMLNRSIEGGGDVSDDDLETELDRAEAALS